MLHAVKVYGSATCPRTERVKMEISAMGVDFDYVDLDVDRNAAAWVMFQSAGKSARTPTVMVGLHVLNDPPAAVLRAAIARVGGDARHLASAPAA